MNPAWYLKLLKELGIRPVTRKPEHLTIREADYLTYFRNEWHPITTQFGLELLQKGYLCTEPDKPGYYSLSAHGADMLDRYNLVRHPLPASAPPDGYIALSDAEIEAAEAEDREFMRCSQCGQFNEDCQCDE